MEAIFLEGELDDHRLYHCRGSLLQSAGDRARSSGSGNIGQPRVLCERVRVCV